MDANKVQEYKAAFQFFDKDNSGQISTDELKAAMSTLGYDLNATQISTILATVDTDKSGQIGFDEFLAFIQKAGC